MEILYCHAECNIHLHGASRGAPLDYASAKATGIADRLNRPGANLPRGISRAAA